MKKFIVDFGRGLIDFSAWVVLAVIIVAGIMSFFSNEPLLGIGILCIGLILFVASYYFIYLFIDIRDLLKIIVEKDNENM